MSESTLFRERVAGSEPVVTGQVVERRASPDLLREDRAATVPHPGFYAARGLGRVFGLDPRAAILTILVDLMLFGGEIISMGILVFFSILASGVLGWIVYRIQKNSYGDDDNTALTKAVIVGLVTAIPTPVTPIIAIPSGIVGAVSLLRRIRK